MPLLQLPNRAPPTLGRVESATVTNWSLVTIRTHLGTASSTQNSLGVWQAVVGDRAPPAGVAQEPDG